MCTYSAQSKPVYDMRVYVAPPPAVHSDSVIDFSFFEKFRPSRGVKFALFVVDE